MIEVKNLTKRYGNSVVIDRVSTQIKRGRITSLIGPNGAGKSTLLALISRLIERDDGEIEIDGVEIRKIPTREIAQKLSILKQDNRVSVRLTVQDLVSFGRFPYSQGRLTPLDWEKINRAIAYMQLEHLTDRFLDQMSGGQRQRAFVAMTLCQDTDYILLDEPLNNLDMKHSVQIMQILRRLVDELGKTIVLVLHDINFASCYSDQIIALKEGQLIKQGSVSEVIHTDALEEIYEMVIPIEEIGGQRLGLYFNSDLTERRVMA
ncbi:MAG: ATP-binding cassette domain-containing protein [Chloroflexota bacterium]